MGWLEWWPSFKPKLIEGFPKGKIQALRWVKEAGDEGSTATTPKTSDGTAVGWR